MIRLTNNNGGFTLLELVIAMLISVVVSLAVAMAYQSQQNSYQTQNEISAIQQNTSAALALMTPELRMAGYTSPEGIVTGIATITAATAGEISVTQDLNGNGNTDDANEEVTFGFPVADDSTRDGILDAGGVASLGRNTGGGFQPIADSIQAVEFYYTSTTGTQSTDPTNFNGIRSVQISILGRAEFEEGDYTNTHTFVTAAGNNWGPFNDRFRRRLSITNVQFRNMGM